jgi:hypothetical protein
MTSARPGISSLLPAGLLLAAVVLAGCGDTPGVGAQRRISELEETLAQRDRQLALAESALDETQRRLVQARAITPEQLGKVFHPVRVEIASLTGGVELDGGPGDDGVTVYVRPIDADGDVVKVAGDIRIELFDLSAPAGQRELGECRFTVDESRKLWYGKFMTQHYTLRCPWKIAPTSPEVTIRVTFVDFLTQRVMTDQRVVTVRLAPRQAGP